MNRATGRLSAADPSCRRARRTPPRAFGLLLAVLAVGCARPVSVETDPERGYAVEVVNRTGVLLDVWFEDGSQRRALGSVAPAASERFVVVDPASPSITIAGSGRGAVYRSTATLRAGETVRVVLAP